MTATASSFNTGTLQQLLASISTKLRSDAPTEWAWDPRPGPLGDSTQEATGKGDCPFLKPGARLFEGHAFWDQSRKRWHLLVLQDADGQRLRWRWHEDVQTVR